MKHASAMRETTRVSSSFASGPGRENHKAHGGKKTVPVLFSRLVVDDVKDVVDLHSDCFPGTFLTRAGKSILRRYYFEFSRSRVAYTVVARHAESRRLLGFAVGTCDSRRVYRQFYYRSSLFVLLPLIHRMMCDAEFRGMLFQRVGQVVRHLMPRKARAVGTFVVQSNNKRSPAARLIGIAVVPAYQGTGVASQILSEYERQLRIVGHARVGLSVESSNSRAIAFYRKNGWDETRSLGATRKFEKALS